jgi:mannose/fructose/N-acetylgalactosamine-specific phosphotransferase system component IIB
MSDSQEDLSAVPMDKLAKVYRKMQAKIQELTQAYENEVETIKSQQELVKHALKDQMLALGVKSVKTEQGTVTLSQKVRYNASDWDAFKEFIKEHDAIDLLEKRVAQTNMAKFLEENPKLLPPGLNSHSEYAISVRKPT